MLAVPSISICKLFGDDAVVMFVMLAIIVTLVAAVMIRMKSNFCCSVNSEYIYVNFGTDIVENLTKEL